MPAVVKALRRQIEMLGGEVRFSCRVEDLDLADGHVRGLHTSSGYVAADGGGSCPGHSARDTYAMLLQPRSADGAESLSAGRARRTSAGGGQSGAVWANPLEDVLGAANYELVARGSNNVFSFCMCAGGYIMPSVSEPGAFCTNGMSLSKHDSPYANSGLVVTLEPAHFGAADVLAGVRLQQEYERKAFAAGSGRISLSDPAGRGFPGRPDDT